MNKEKDNNSIKNEKKLLTNISEKTEGKTQKPESI